MKRIAAGVAVLGLLFLGGCPMARVNLYDPGADTGRVALPWFTLEPGEYATPQQTEIGCNTEGAVIYYTTDGTDPTESSAAYTGAIVIATATQIRAIAVKEGLTDSEVAALAVTFRGTDGDPPADVTALVVGDGNGELTLTWTDPADADLDHIEITWTPGGSTPVMAAAGDETYHATGLDNETEYTFTARSVDISGNKATGATASGTAYDAVFVATAGTAGNSGLRPGLPKSTIADGITAAAAAGRSQVRVAEGTYNVNASIVMQSGVSLYGGYAAGFGARVPGATPTSIVDTRTTWAVYDFTVDFEGVTGSALDGFRVFGPSTADVRASYVVYLNNAASVTVRGNRIQAGSVGGGGSTAVLVEGSASGNVIEDNYIISGASTDLGACVNSSGGGTVIRRNRLQAVGSPTCVGVYVAGPGGESIQNNVILAKDGSAQTNAILLAGGTGTIIDNNTICVSGFSDIAIRNRAASAVIRNNILVGLTGSANIGVHEESGGSVAVLQNNLVYGFASALFRDFGSGTYWLDIADLNDSTKTTQGVAASSAGNVTGDPLLVDRDGADGDVETMGDNDWHLQSGSPAGARTGGKDLSAVFTTDLDGVTRTAPWSMGAFELD